MMEVQVKCSAALENAKRLSALRSDRQRIVSEIGMLPANRDVLELKGKTLHDEKQRLSAELSAVEAKEREILTGSQQLVSALGNELVLSFSDRLREQVQLPRLRLRELITEAVAILRALQSFGNAWTEETKALAALAQQLTKETGENYRLPESPLPELAPPLDGNLMRRSDCDLLKILESALSKIQ